jgi:hypothetical protein
MDILGSCFKSKKINRCNIPILGLCVYIKADHKGIEYTNSFHWIGCHKNVSRTVLLAAVFLSEKEME